MHAKDNPKCRLDESGAGIELRNLRDAEDVRECARMMAASEPWITLGRTYDDSLTTISDPSKEVYVAVRDEKVVGFTILNMSGAFVGYIQSVCVAPEWRSKGIGTLLLRFAEERILSETPNVFMCVSSFNESARRLYESLGYEIVGELKDYIVPGHSEILLRKTIAPLTRFAQDSSAVEMFICNIDANVALRSLSLEDVDQFFKLVYENRQHLGKWMFWVTEDYSLADAQRHITEAQERFAAKNGFEAGIWFNGQLAGCIRYNYIDWTHRNTELRYWLGADFEGNGLATKACRALIEHAFSELGLHRVEIRCMSENTKSRRVPERLGFVKEGVLREVRWRSDHFVDHIVYGMLATQWESVRH